MDKMIRLRRESGFMLVVVLLLLVMMSLLGVWSLNTTSGGLLRSGNYRSIFANQNSAEDAIRMSALRIQQIWANNDSMNTSSPAQPKQKTFLTTNTSGGPCVPDNPGCVTGADANPPCGVFAANKDQDLPSTVSGATSNVICNFMGTNLPDTQVILARKADNPSAATNAIYLVTSIHTDNLGRRQIMQGVVVVSYGSTLPYLATIAKVIE